MADETDQRTEPAAWDRVGRFLEDIGQVTQDVFRRNLELWRAVATGMREDRYTADAMARDAARAMTAAIDNVGDVWELWTRPSEREQVAGDVPSAVLYYQSIGLLGTALPRTEELPAGPTHSPPDPVRIAVPFRDDRQLPEEAEIALGGPTAEAAAKLRRTLAARRTPGPSYLLEPHDVGELDPGVYDGVVYLTQPFRALANLRVVVQDPAPGT
jgi:hypothetical protein